MTEEQKQYIDGLIVAFDYHPPGDELTKLLLILRIINEEIKKLI